MEETRTLGRKALSSRELETGTNPHTQGGKGGAMAGSIRAEQVQPSRSFGLGTSSRVTPMPADSETCRARALRCLEVAEKAPTPEDRREFLTFAESWERLANEIERNERFVTLIDELAAKNLTDEDTQRDSDELAECQRAGMRSRHVPRTQQARGYSMSPVSTAIVAMSANMSVPRSELPFEASASSISSGYTSMVITTGRVGGST